MLTDECKTFYYIKRNRFKIWCKTIRRAIQRYIEDEISEMILKQEILNGQKINIEFKNDKLIF